MNGMTIDLTPILELVLSVAAALVTMHLIPWIKARTTASQQEYIRTAVHVAVYAAEKFWGAGNGDAKLEYAQSVLRDEYGIKINTAALRATIEATIKEMEQQEPKYIEGELLASEEGEQAEA